MQGNFVVLLLCLRWLKAVESVDNSKLYRTRVSPASLSAAARTMEFTAPTEIVCAIIANNHPWSKMTCYSNETKKCILTDICAAAYDKNGSDPDSVECLTFYSPSACVIDTATAYEPMEIFATGCNFTICKDGELLPFDPATIQADYCTAPFLNIPFVGCLYMHLLPVTWCDAQALCANLDAQLIVPSDFSEMEAYLMVVALLQNVWVGIKDETWLNGDPVSGGHWASGFPIQGSDNCGSMSFVLGLPPRYLAKEESCTKLNFAACYRPQAPVCELSLLECAALMLG